DRAEQGDRRGRHDQAADKVGTEVRYVKRRQPARNTAEPGPNRLDIEVPGGGRSSAEKECDDRARHAPRPTVGAQRHSEAGQRESRRGRRPCVRGGGQRLQAWYEIARYLIDA